MNPLNPSTNDPSVKVYATLDGLGITYETYAHPPIFTSEEAAEHWAGIDGAKIKNLFLRNKKGDRHYLVILEVSKRADLRQIVKIVGDDRLSFGSPERLMANLGITPGSVSPFGLIHDASRRGARDHRRGLAVGAPPDLSPEHQHGQRHDQRD